uniref:F-box domain-containing protein n=1 Tax=Ditylenchus dipsaci TaxID=166011 RepID=A0A915DFD2_9BILA
MPNEVLMEIYRFCTYNDLNTLALTNSQLQTIQLDNAPIARMHCLEVSSQGFTLQYSCNSTRKRLFPTFDDFVSCARKVRPKIHTLQLINMHDSEEEDSCLRKLFSIELYRFCTNLINPLIRLRFYCCGVMHRGLWYHGDVCPYDDDWNRLMHEGHTLSSNMDAIFRAELHLIPSLIPQAPEYFMELESGGLQHFERANTPPALIFGQHPLRPDARYTLVKLKLNSMSIANVDFKQECLWLVINMTATGEGTHCQEHKSGIYPKNYQGKNYRYVYLVYEQRTKINIDNQDANFNNWDLKTFVDRHMLGAPVYGSAYVDVTTQWNSTFYMSQRLLEQRKAVNLYVTRYDK